MMLSIIFLSGINLVWLRLIMLGKRLLILFAMTLVIVLYTTLHKEMGQKSDITVWCGTFGTKEMRVLLSVISKATK